MVVVVFPVLVLVVVQVAWCFMEEIRRRPLSLSLAGSMRLDCLFFVFVFVLQKPTCKQAVDNGRGVGFLCPWRELDFGASLANTAANANSNYGWNTMSILELQL